MPKLSLTTRVWQLRASHFEQNVFVSSRDESVKAKLFWINWGYFLQLPSLAIELTDQNLPTKHNCSWEKAFSSNDKDCKRVYLLLNLCSETRVTADPVPTSIDKVWSFFITFTTNGFVAVGNSTLTKNIRLFLKKPQFEWFSHPLGDLSRTVCGLVVFLESAFEEGLLDWQTFYMSPTFPHLWRNIEMSLDFVICNKQNLFFLLWLLTDISWLSCCSLA